MYENKDFNKIMVERFHQRIDVSDVNNLSSVSYFPSIFLLCIKVTLVSTLLKYHLADLSTTYLYNTYHGLRISNAGINQRYLKNWADGQTKYASAVPRNLGLGVNCQPCSAVKAISFLGVRGLCYILKGMYVIPLHYI